MRDFEATYGYGWVRLTTNDVEELSRIKWHRIDEKSAMSERREESSATRFAIIHIQLDFDRGSLINERNHFADETVW